MTSWEQGPSVGIGLLALLAGIGALYVGREFFIPIALALLLNALLRPLVRGLERLRVPTVAGATLVVLGLLGGLTAGGFALVDPIRAWVSQVPASIETAARKLEPARHSLEHVSQAAQAVTEPAGARPAAPAPPAVPPFLTQLFGTTATLMAGLAEVLLLLYLLLASGTSSCASRAYLQGFPNLARASTALDHRSMSRSRCAQHTCRRHAGYQV